MKVGRSTLETLSWGKKMVSGRLFIMPKEESITRENSMMDLKVAKVMRSLKMVTHIQDPMLEISFKAKESINGKMELFIKGLSSMDTNMGKGS